MTEQFDEASVSFYSSFELLLRNNSRRQLSTIHAQLRQREIHLPYFLLRKDTSGTVSLAPVEDFDSFFASTPPEAVSIPSYLSLRLTHHYLYSKSSGLLTPLPIHPIQDGPFAISWHTFGPYTHPRLQLFVFSAGVIQKSLRPMLHGKVKLESFTFLLLSLQQWNLRVVLLQLVGRRTRKENLVLGWPISHP